MEQILDNAPTNGKEKYKVVGIEPSPSTERVTVHGLLFLYLYIQNSISICGNRTKSSNFLVYVWCWLLTLNSS